MERYSEPERTAYAQAVKERPVWRGGRLPRGFANHIPTLGDLVRVKSKDGLKSGAK